MRHLPSCQTFCSNHHEKAWVVLSDVAAMLRDVEENHPDEGATLILLDIKMDEDALYYANFVVEFPTEEQRRAFDEAVEALGL